MYMGIAVPEREVDSAPRPAATLTERRCDGGGWVQGRLGLGNTAGSELPAGRGS